MPITSPTRRAGRFACAAALLLVVAGCEIGVPGPARVEIPADTAAGEISFELAGPGGAALIVPVHINGEGPFEFVLDTGATLTCVDQSVTERLALPERRGPGAIGAGIEGMGQVPLVRVDSLRVGGVRAMDFTACVLDLEHTRALGVTIHGLLGLNFLRSFRMILDFEREILTLQEP